MDWKIRDASIKILYKKNKLVNKKVYNEKKVSIIIIIAIIALIPYKVYAGSGCCSWHGGQAYCDTNVGKWVCNDGTYSPSCNCGSYDSGYELTDNSNYSNNCKNNTLKLEDKIRKLEAENEKLKQENKNYDNWMAFFIFVLITYIIYKTIKTNSV